MSDVNPSKPGPSIQEIRARSGMMEGTAEDLSKVLPPEELPKEETQKVELVKEPSKEESKPEAKDESEEEEDAAEEEDESEEENDGVNDDKSTDKTPAKPSRPLQTLLKRMGDNEALQRQTAETLKDVAEAMKAMASAQTKSEKGEAKAEVKQSVSELIAKAKDSGADAEWLQQFAKTLTDELDGKFKSEIKSLTEKLQETEKTASELKAEREAQVRVRAESSTFSNEWLEIVPQLQKQYPNASPELLKEARSEMQKLAMSKEYGGESLDGKDNKGKQPMPLDYVLFKEKAKFDTILNVKKGRSGETSTGEPNEIPDTGKSEDIDLNPETMTPQKFKEYQKRKIAEYTPEKDWSMQSPR